MVYITPPDDDKSPAKIFKEYGGPKSDLDEAPGFDTEMHRQGHFRGSTDVEHDDEERKDYYIHYTSRKNIVGIATSRVLPNKKNKVYLTKAF